METTAAKIDLPIDEAIIDAYSSIGETNPSLVGLKRRRRVLIADLVNFVPELIAEIRRLQRFEAKPSVLFKPRVFLDGDSWCCLYGVAGFGDTPELACEAFDAEWVRAIAKRETGGAG